jgi:acyl-CoA synthetase (AMP-forming)/AMP-acid ligase II
MSISPHICSPHSSPTAPQQLVIADGRPGAGGTNDAAIVAKAEPYGYTLFLMAYGHATSPTLYRKLPYDPVSDFTMMAKTGHNRAARELHDWCTARLAAFKAPRYVAFVDALPHTPTHKIAKHRLKHDTAALLAQAKDTNPAKNI